MKKCLSLLLAVFLCLSVSACGTGGQPSGPEIGPSSESVSPASVPSEPSSAESVSAAPDSSQSSEPQPQRSGPSSIILSQGLPSGYQLWELNVEDEEEIALVESLLSAQNLTPSNEEEANWPDGGSSIDFVIHYEDRTVEGACNPQLITSADGESEVQVAQGSYVDAVVDALNEDWYGGVYYEGDTVHIIATQGNAEKIQAVINRIPDPDEINIFVVDTAVKGRRNAKVYSITEMKKAQADLLSRLKELGIIAVGFNGQENALTIYLADYENATDAQKEKIVAASSVKNIIFNDGIIFSFLDDYIDEEGSDTGSAADLETPDEEEDHGQYSRLFVNSVFYNYPQEIGDQLLAFLKGKGITPE